MNLSLKKYKKDLIFIAAVLMIAVAAVVFMLVSRSGGGKAIVRVNGVIVAEYSLKKDGTYSLNGGTNTLVIENGICRMTYADCPDKICVKTGAVSYNGQSIICLPNKVTVTVSEHESGIDVAG